MKVAIYCRVSKEDPNGVSVPMQRERLSAYAVARGWQVTETYVDDGASAKTLNRPSLSKLLLDAKAGRFDTLLIYRLDRLTRSVKDLADLLEYFERYKVALVSLSESIDASTAAGRLMLNVIGSISQWERETISERTATALRFKKRSGFAYGPVAYGFVRRGERLEPLERELQHVREVFAMRREGMTLRAIAAALNAKGIKTKKGKRWAAEQVRSILGNDIYSITAEGKAYIEAKGKT